jgi:hypothetical protein
MESLDKLIRRESRLDKILVEELPRFEEFDRTCKELKIPAEYKTRFLELIPIFYKSRIWKEVLTIYGNGGASNDLKEAIIAQKREVSQRKAAVFKEIREERESWERAAEQDRWHYEND